MNNRHTEVIDCPAPYTQQHIFCKLIDYSSCRITFGSTYMIDKFPNKIAFSSDITANGGVYRFITRSKRAVVVWSILFHLIVWQANLLIIDIPNFTKMTFWSDDLWKLLYIQH